MSQSAQRTVTEFFAFIPELIAGVLILLVGWFLAKALGGLVARVLGRAGLDRTLNEGQAGGFVQKVTGSPSKLVGKLVFWVVLLGAISLAVSVLGINALTAFVAAIYAYLPNVLAAVLIFLVAGAISATVATLATKFMGDTPTGRVVATVAPILVMTIATFMILEQLKIAHDIVVTTYTLLLGAIALASALAFGLGGRDVAARMLEGAYAKGQEQTDQVKRDMEKGKERARQEVDQGESSDSSLDRDLRPQPAPRRPDRKRDAKEKHVELGGGRSPPSLPSRCPATVRGLAGGVSIRVLTSLGELDAEASRWKELDRAAVTPAQTFAWIHACAASFGEELRVVLVEEDDELLAAAPLAVGEGALELAGARDLYEPADLAYRDPAALAALARAIAALGRGVVLPRLLAGAPTLQALRRAFRGRGVVIVRAAGATPVLELGGDPEARFSGRRRNDLRRARRRAEEGGAILAEILSPSAAELEFLLSEFFAVEAAGWKGVSGTALLHDARRRGFFEEYAASCADEGSLRICRLRIGDQTAAVQLAVEHAGRIWLLKIGYDERFARCSPGTLLLLETAKWATENGLEAIELLGDREPWTRLWTDREEPSVAVHVYPATVRGARSLAGDVAGHVGRGLTRRLVARAERGHVAGPELEDALVAARKVDGPVALAFWDGPEDTASKAEASSLAVLEAIAENGFDGYVSLKPAAFGFARERLERILSRADELALVVHFDSTGPEDADPAWKLLAELARPGLGCTLPGSWCRSAEDAERAVELGLRVRVVKGQWPEPGIGERAGLLALVDSLAGRAAHVAVATHDRQLAEEAIGRLLAAGTPVEHELMLGLPRRGGDRVTTRVYVPFGHPYLPYAPGRAKRSARIAGWVARDLVRGLRR